MRAPIQILVFLYRKNTTGDFEYAVFQRANGGFWQGIAGGGEDDETPLQAAVRETLEEAGLLLSEDWLQLQTVGCVPVTEFSGREHWPDDLYVIPIHCFGVLVGDGKIILSHEHAQMAWLPFEEAHDRVKFDIDRTALWELDQRLTNPKGTAPTDSWGCP